MSQSHAPASIPVTSVSFPYWLASLSLQRYVLCICERDIRISEQRFLGSFLRRGRHRPRDGAHCGPFLGWHRQIISENGRFWRLSQNPDILTFLGANTDRDKVDVHALALSAHVGSNLRSGVRRIPTLSRHCLRAFECESSTVKTQNLG